ncbi:alpha-ketoglutarate-dependent dioxygenase AlkB family protein [Arachidicoccus soli]|uniref:alpha-ketoglutarate-dependent dioxygenase AlkB family protein n=1 Tax=Arachidicoccus soli TaxID=2341117 RepID=UPI001969020C|nr:alpha-ketoglutarate-dependent dioxygenase AlkB [Arachidicoccus soli]
MLELFDNAINPDINLLPKDGIVNYYGKIFSTTEADNYKNIFLYHIEWKNDTAVIFGKLITTKRKVAWYGDQKFEYRYSNVARQALPWTDELLQLKNIIEEKTGETYNSCLMNLYHNGEEGVGWHSDGEPDLKEDGAIASLSFGAERKFVFKHKLSKEMVPILLEHGSLLVMKSATQRYWLHRLPPVKTIKDARVNLTFRTIVRESEN